MNEIVIEAIMLKSYSMRLGMLYRALFVTTQAAKEASLMLKDLRLSGQLPFLSTVSC